MAADGLSAGTGFFHEHFERLPDPRRVARGEEVGLRVPHPARPLLLRPLRDLRRKPEGGGPLFPRVGEDAEVVPTGFVDETEQTFEGGPRLPGETDDQGRPQEEAGNPDPEAVEHPADRIGTVRPPHPAQDSRVDVLDGNVQIPTHLLLRSQEIDDPVVDAGGVKIEEPDPPDAPDGAQGAHQGGEPPLLPAVQAVRGDVLPDEVQLPGAPAHQKPRLREKRFPVPAPQGTPDCRNRAVGAPVVAPLQDFQERRSGADLGEAMAVRFIGKRPAARHGALRGTARQRSDRSQHRGEAAREVRDVAGTEEQIDFGEQFREFVPIPPRHAAGDNQAPDPSPPLLRRQGEDCLDRLFLGGPHETAGIQDRRVGPAAGHDEESTFRQEARHDLGIHRVFSAPESVDANRRRLRRPPRQPSTTETPAGFRNRKKSAGREGFTVTSVR